MDLLTGGKKADFGELSGRFYSLIPTKSGFTRPPAIDNGELLGAKLSLLEFWLRMGFEDMNGSKRTAPIAGLLELPLPESLGDAAADASDSAAIENSVARGTELAAKQAGGPQPKMDKELYAAIVLYTSNSTYRALNGALCSENREQDQKYFRYLRLFIEAMGRMPQREGRLWRGISANLFDQYAEGKVIARVLCLVSGVSSVWCLQCLVSPVPGVFSVCCPGKTLKGTAFRTWSTSTPRARCLVSLVSLASTVSIVWCL